VRENPAAVENLSKQKKNIDKASSRVDPKMFEQRIGQEKVNSVMCQLSGSFEKFVFVFKSSGIGYNL
jgi:hypothetical protein